MKRTGTWIVLAGNLVWAVLSGFDPGVVTVAGSVVAMWLAVR